MDNPTLTIPAPKFDQYEDVWLHFKGATIPTHVVARRYHLESGHWKYQIAAAPQDWFYSSFLDYRTEEGA